VEVAGGLYHVIVRGNERRNVFRDDRDRERYLARLAVYREKFEFQLLAYCLMDPGYLVVSSKCLSVLKRHKIDHCNVEPLSLDPDRLKTAQMEP